MAEYKIYVDQIGNTTATQVSDADPLPVAVSSLSAPTGPTTGTESNVSGSASSVTILAANAGRKGAVIVNDSTATLYLLLSDDTASTTKYTFKLLQDDSVTLEPGDYTGKIVGIWASATGAARVTEFV